MEVILFYLKYILAGIIVLIPFLSLYIFVRYIVSRIESIPASIYMRCPICGKTHNLFVLRFLSNPLKGKYVVFCSNRYRFDTLYADNFKTK